MKKSFLLLALIVLFISVNPSKTFASTSNVSSSSIESVIYEDGHYVAITKDLNGGSWDIAIVKKSFNEQSLKWLNSKYKGTTVQVSYNGDLENDTEVEITKVEWSVWK